MNLIRLKNKSKVPFILPAWFRSSHKNGSVHCFLFAFLILFVNQISVSKGAPIDPDVSTINSTKSSVNNIQVANLTKESRETNETLSEKKAETSNNITIVKGANETKTGDSKLTNATIVNQLKIEINGTTIRLGENNDTVANNSKADIKKDESLKDEAKKTETTLKIETKNNETKIDETTKVENKMTEAPKNDTKKEEPPKDATKKDDAPKDDTTKDDAPKDDAKKDDAPKDDTQKEDPSKKNPNDDEEEKTPDYDAPPEDDSPNQIKPPNNPKSDTDDVPPEKKAQDLPMPKQPSFDSLGNFLKVNVV